MKFSFADLFIEASLKPFISHGTNVEHNNHNMSIVIWSMSGNAVGLSLVYWRCISGVWEVCYGWQSVTLSPVARFHCPTRRDELRVVAVFISANDGCRGVVWPAVTYQVNCTLDTTSVACSLESISILRASGLVGDAVTGRSGSDMFFHEHTPTVEKSLAWLRQFLNRFLFIVLALKGLVNYQLLWLIWE